MAFLFCLSKHSSITNTARATSNTVTITAIIIPTSIGSSFFEFIGDDAFGSPMLAVKKKYH